MGTRAYAWMHEPRGTRRASRRRQARRQANRAVSRARNHARRRLVQLHRQQSPRDLDTLRALLRHSQSHAQQPRGYLREMHMPLRCSDGLVHEVMRNETQHQWGQLRCLLWYTGRDRSAWVTGKHDTVQKVDRVVDDREVTCIACVIAMSKIRRIRRAGKTRTGSRIPSSNSPASTTSSRGTSSASPRVTPAASSSPKKSSLGRRRAFGART